MTHYLYPNKFAQYKKYEVAKAAIGDDNIDFLIPNAYLSETDLNYDSIQAKLLTYIDRYDDLRIVAVGFSPLVAIMTKLAVVYNIPVVFFLRDASVESGFREIRLFNN